MSEFAIQAENISKLYHIGGNRAHYKTLRDTLSGILSLPLRRLRQAGKTRPKADRTIWALHDLSFEVQPGEIVGVIGRNGAGKSTLLKILSRITEPTEGRARIHGRVGSLLEVGTGFHSELTGRENVLLNGAILGMRRAEIKSKFDAIVAFAELDRFIDTPVKHYSSGMYMRLAFAVAAHLEPEILLIDEVLAVGDAEFQRRCIGKMQEVGRSGRTVLFVSHNLSAIANLCGRVMLIEDGRLAADGAPEVVIGTYLTRREGVVHELAERRNRSGTGRMRFTNLVLRNGEGGDLSVAQAGDEVSFVLEYSAPDSDSLTNVKTEIKIADQFGGLLVTLSTFLLGQNFALLPGRGKVSCNVPAMLLAPGVYDLTLMGYVNGELADQIDIPGTLTIAGGDYYGSGKLPRQNLHGSMLLPHAWHEGERAHKRPESDDPVHGQGGRGHEATRGL